MIAKSEAEALVREYLKALGTPSLPFAIKEDATIENPYGWIFFYNTERYLKSGDFIYALAGNGPILVSKENGAFFFGPTTQSLQAFIEECEEIIGDEAVREVNRNTANGGQPP